MKTKHESIRLLMMSLVVASCKTTAPCPGFVIPESPGNRSFCACDDVSYFLGLDPEGSISATIATDCTITYGQHEILAHVHTQINFGSEEQIPESAYPEGFVFLRIPDPGKRSIFFSLNDSGKRKIPFVGPMKFPEKAQSEPEPVFQ